MAYETTVHNYIALIIKLPEGLSPENFKMPMTDAVIGQMRGIDDRVYELASATFTTTLDIGRFLSTLGNLGNKIGWSERKLNCVKNTIEISTEESGQLNYI